MLSPTCFIDSIFLPLAFLPVTIPPTPTLQGTSQRDDSQTVLVSNVTVPEFCRSQVALTTYLQPYGLSLCSVSHDLSRDVIRVRVGVNFLTGKVLLYFTTHRRSTISSIYAISCTASVLTHVMMMFRCLMWSQEADL